MPTLLLVERDTHCTFIVMAVERDTPCTFLLLVVVKGIPQQVQTK
jgi:hypothetical protein